MQNNKNFCVSQISVTGKPAVSDPLLDRKPLVRLFCKLVFALTIFISITGFINLAFAQQTTNKKARILIVTGIDYPGHEWKKTTPALTNLLSEDPRLIIDVLYNPNELGKVDLRQFDAVLLHFMNWQTTSPPFSARTNLQQFVKNGGGLMLIHFACGAWQDWDEFKNIAGRVWNPKLRAHDPRGEFTVEIVDKEHPITRGLKDFKTDAGTVEGLLRFDENFELKLEEKKTVVKPISDASACPKCKKGTVLKGNTAYGCSDYKSGCDFKVPFEVVRAKLKDQKPTKELVYAILKESF